MDPTPGTSAQWDAADRVLFSWLDLPTEKVEARVSAMRQQDPALAAALQSRLGQLRRLGIVTGLHEAPGPVAGRTFAAYEIVRLLGTGGMGSVYLAEQRSPRRQVALKVIRPDRLGDRAARDRFQREAHAVAMLRDPGICTLFEVGEVDGAPFLAMQYIAGETLAERLVARRAAARTEPASSGGPQTPADIQGVLQLIEKVARSLHVAHEAGVVPYELSIDAEGKAYRGKHNGEDALFLDAFTRASVDVVERGAAGGKFLRLKESDTGDEPKESRPMKDKLLFLFTLAYPTFLESKGVDVVTADENALFTYLMEADKPQSRVGQMPDGGKPTESWLDEKIAAIREAWIRPETPKPPPAPPKQDDSMKAVLESMQKELAANRLRMCEAMLNSTLAGAKLPKSVEPLIREQFAGKEFEQKDLNAAIKRTQEAFGKFLTDVPSTHGMSVRMGMMEAEKGVEVVAKNHPPFRPWRGRGGIRRGDWLIGSRCKRSGQQDRGAQHGRVASENAHCQVHARSRQ